MAVWGHGYTLIGVETSMHSQMHIKTVSFMQRGLGTINSNFPFRDEIEICFKSKPSSYYRRHEQQAAAGCLLS